jgi:hypothetical protein
VDRLLAAYALLFMPHHAEMGRVDIVQSGVRAAAGWKGREWLQLQACCMLWADQLVTGVRRVMEPQSCLRCWIA